MEKAYETYKDSGVEWIGKIPENWKSVSLKWISNITKGRKPKVDYDESGENLLPYLSMEFLRDKTSNPTYASIDEKGLVFVDDGDILILWDGSKAGEIVKAKKGALSSTMAKIDITDSDFESTYLNYLLQLGEKHIQENTIGMGIPHVSGDVLKGLKMLLPPKQEQTQIAAYLDYHTLLIDTLISKKETLIQKLQEQRQAIINEAVTKGLNKNVALKDSGIEWLGEIPEHWKFIKISSVAKENRYSITGGPFGSDLKNEEFTSEGVRIIQLQNIGVGEFRDSYKIYTSEEKADQLFSCNIFPGDLIIAKMADPVARACIMPDFDNRYIMASDGIRFEVDENKASTKFLEYAINSKYFNFQAELKSTGTTRLRIGLTEFKKLKLLLPPLEEQEKVLEFIELKDSSIKNSTNYLYNSIEKLNDYRQSLISEAVTGKIDVREWQHPSA